jgi:SAM-dependent methyltransferase
MQGDITRGLPSGLERFDAVFCLQAFHCFGTRLSTVRYLATLLKPGGRLCISQGCFKQEPITLPPLFRETGGWQPEYEKYHSPGWWRDHLLASGEFEVELAEELPHGGAIWEDDVLYRGDRSGWSDEFLTRSGWLIRQIAHGQTGTPSLTHCIVRAVKTEERS